MKQKIVLMLALLTFSWVQINAQQQFFTPDEIITKVKAGTDVKGLAMKVTLVEQGSTQFKATNVSEGSSVILNRGDNQELTAAGTFNVTIVTFVAGSGTNANVYTLTCKLYVAPKEPEPESPCNRHYESAVKFIVDTPVVHTFTVNPRTGAKVIFSSGNLQYCPAKDQWRFALRQFDRCGNGKSQYAPEGLKAVGKDSTMTTVFYDSIDYSTKESDGSYKVIKNVPCNNLLASKTYQGWIDLFGWGTSGHGQKVGDKEAVYYYPYERNNINFGGSNQYGYGPSWKEEAWGEGALNSNFDKHSGTNRLFDWGYANFIREYHGSVFDDAGHWQYSTDSTMYHTGIWRTMTIDEWKYMLSERKVDGNDSAFTKVRLQWGKNNYDTVSGMIIYPDDFSFTDAGVAPLTFGGNYLPTAITLPTWEMLEEAGCVFLPNSYTVYANSTQKPTQSEGYAGTYTYYWSSTASGNGHGYTSYYYSPRNSTIQTTKEKYFGVPVRLVQDYYDPCDAQGIEIKDTTVVIAVNAKYYRGTAFGTGKTYQTGNLGSSTLKQRYNVDTLRTAEFGCDSAILRITVRYPEFTINADGDKATFSPGNLTYNPSSTTSWSFQRQQYNRQSTYNINTNGVTTNTIIDLFGWGTSGELRAPNYINTSSSNYTWSDWGRNKITFDGREFSANTWRTPSREEFSYVIYNRSGHCYSLVWLRRSTTTTDTVSGMILYPDGFDFAKAGITPMTTNTNDVTYNTTNIVPKTRWDSLEKAGCVFFPSVGYRNGSVSPATAYYDANYIGNYAWYWTKTVESSSYSYILRIQNMGAAKKNVAIASTNNRNGCAVRLIRDLPKDY